MHYLKNLIGEKAHNILHLIIGVWLFLLISTVLLLFAVNQFELRKKSTEVEPTIYSTQEYSIIFLDNNLFYFCKLEDFNSEYIKCNDPYYLVRRKEAGADGKNEEQVYVTKPSEEEIYEPEGPIYLKKDNIVYIAKVGSESSVIEYINTQK